MVRQPIEVYRGLVEVRLADGIIGHISPLVSRFSNDIFAGQKTADHLTRFLALFSRFTAFLSSSATANLDNLEMAVDLLDYFTSTSKWWVISRKKPCIIPRPPSRDPRDFLKSIADIQLGSDASGRITTSTEKLSQFLSEHGIADGRTRQALCESFGSIWTLLSGFVCRSQGRGAISEADFEAGYDTFRVMLFYVPIEDFMALTAIRRVGTNDKLPRIARIAVAAGFERKLDSSVAARLERLHGENLAKVAVLTSGASRAVLTNSLRFIAQLATAEKGVPSIEDTEYETMIEQAIEILQKAGVDSSLFQDENAVAKLFKSLRISDEMAERISLVTRRLEGLIIDTAGSHDFLLQYSRLVPRLVSLLLLLASGTRPPSDTPLQDVDMKKGLMSLNQLLSERSSP